MTMTERNATPKQYEKPELKEFGRVSELTQILQNAPGMADGGLPANTNKSQP